jgi:hypothetical protein
MFTTLVEGGESRCAGGQLFSTGRNLFFNHPHQGLGVFIVVFVRLPLGRHGVNERLGHAQFLCLTLD